jgi:hypothetical protein
MIRLLAHAPPPSSGTGSKLPLFLSLPVCRRSILLTGEEGGGGRGAKSDDREKAWSSINHSILSGEVPVRHAEGVMFLFSGQEPIYFIENKEKTLRARASYDRGTQIFDYMV